MHSTVDLEDAHNAVDQMGVFWKMLIKQQMENKKGVTAESYNPLILLLVPKGRLELPRPYDH